MPALRVQIAQVEDPDGGLHVAKTVLLEGLSEDDQALALQEVKLLKNLSHHHVVAYRKSFLCQNTQLCIVMEYCDGGDLRKVRRKRFQ